MGLENIRMSLGDSFSLHTLEAAQITISEDIVTPLTKLFLDTVQDLKHLNISKNNIKQEYIDDNLDDLESNCQLEVLNFSNNREITSNSKLHLRQRKFIFLVVQNLLQTIPTLQEIILFGTKCSQSDFEPHQISKLKLSC